MLKETTKTIKLKKTLKKVKTLFKKIELAMLNITNEENEDILYQHNEVATLQHCIRWGNKAVEELLEDFKK